MIRVVVDTNVLFSAVLIPGSNPAKILKLAQLGNIKLIFSPHTLKELQRVLRYPKLVALMKKRGIKPHVVDNFVKNLVSISMITSGEKKVTAVKEDPADDLFIACAIEGEAKFIISRDHHLRSLKTFQGITILDPTSFLKTINKKT